MKTVEDYEALRQAFFFEGLSIRANHRQLNYDRETIRKAIVNPTPQPYQLTCIVLNGGKENESPLPTEVI